MGAEVGLGGWRGGWGFARLLVFLPGCFLALGGAVERALAPGAGFGGEGAADVVFMTSSALLYFRCLMIWQTVL